MVPTFNGGNDLIGIGGPDERPGGFGVVLLDVAADGVLEVGDGFEGAALKASTVIMEKNPSTALSQEAEVGVKWKVQRG